MRRPRPDQAREFSKAAMLAMMARYDPVLAHLRRASRGHLLKNSSGHLIYDCGGCDCSLCSATPASVSVTVSGVSLADCCSSTPKYTWGAINGGPNDTFSLPQDSSDCCYFHASSDVKRAQETSCNDGTVLQEAFLTMAVVIYSISSQTRICFGGALGGGAGPNGSYFVGCGDISQCIGTHTLSNTVTACETDYTGSCQDCDTLGDTTGSGGSADITV